MKQYNYDSVKNIYINSDGKQLKYSDGGEEERKLMEIAASGIDLSTFSDELPAKMNSWPSEYHFSRKRHLLARQFDIKPGDSVLELGAGCGSVTRYFAEIGADVTSVEGTEARASINGLRCKDFENVKIYVDNITEFEIEKKFDWIFMIGVLEYSPKYAKTNNPPEEYLSIAKKYLSTHGKFVLAIENKLGIKYFNGASEDHNGKLFYGPEDLYNKTDITTWGKKELRQILRNSGFKETDFYSSFPDYKLPTLLIHESADECMELRTEELLHYMKSHDYRGKNKRLAEESFVAGSLRKNGLLSNFANSFVIVCSLNESEKSSVDLATYYSVGRKKEYCTKTTFKTEGDSLIVEKEFLFDKDKSRKFNITLQDDEVITISQNFQSKSNYLNGQLLGYLYSKAQKRSNVQDVTTILDIWIEVLMDNFKLYSRQTKKELAMNDISGHQLSDILIDGNAIDCGMHNIIINPMGTVPFDLEWRANQAVPLGWVLLRNITVAARDNYKIMPRITNETILNYVCKKLNLTCNDKDHTDAKTMEKIFGLNITKRERSDSWPLQSMLIN